jgi:hypothetical protein
MGLSRRKFPAGRLCCHLDAQTFIDGIKYSEIPDAATSLQERANFRASAPRA